MKKSLEDATYDGGTLPEVEVKLKPWQKDFHTNFGSKKLRRNIINSFIQDKLASNQPLRVKTNYIKAIQPYAKQEAESYSAYVGNVLSIDDPEKRYNVIRKYNEEIDNIHKAIESSKVVKAAETLDDNPDIYPEIARLYNVWNEADRPRLNSYQNIIPIYHDNGESRANYNPLTNTAYNINTFSDAIAELAHPIQYKHGDRNKWYQYLINFPETIYEETIGNQRQYDNPKHYEYDTHNVVEPELRNYIKFGTPTKYLPFTLKTVKPK